MKIQSTIQSDLCECPLCRRGGVFLFFEDKHRTYLCCPTCTLIFVPEKYWLSREDEKITYDLHENNAKDKGYRQFLSRLSTPLLARLPAKQKGLDFGCGPGPTLSTIFIEQGHQMDLYDPYYCNDPAVFERKYDFICATEVMEHLSAPHRQLAAVFKMLKPGGWLGVMTKLVTDKQAFSSWHYIRDLTHICFYSQSTFRYLAQQFNAKLYFVVDDVVLLKKNCE